MDLAHHSGVVAGLTEEGLDCSLLRLATNAACQGWKVVMFDAHSTQAQAATFVAAMRAARCQSITALPVDEEDDEEDPFDFPWNPLPQAVRARRLVTILPMGLSLPPMLSIGRELPSCTPPPVVFHQRVPERSVPRGTGRVPWARLPISFTYERADAVYFGFNAASCPLQEQRLAEGLLLGLTRFLNRQVQGDPPVLLLIKGPASLFQAERLASLFALLEQARGSLFIATRSPADEGFDGAKVLKNAKTLILHRSPTTLPYAPYVALPWPRWNGFFDGIISQFTNRECFVIHRGRCAHLRVRPVHIPAEDSIWAWKCLFLPNGGNDAPPDPDDHAALAQKPGRSSPPGRKRGRKKPKASKRQSTRSNHSTQAPLQKSLLEVEEPPDEDLLEVEEPPDEDLLI